MGPRRGGARNEIPKVQEVNPTKLWSLVVTAAWIAMVLRVVLAAARTLRF